MWRAEPPRHLISKKATKWWHLKVSESTLFDVPLKDLVFWRLRRHRIVFLGRWPVIIAGFGPNWPCSGRMTESTSRRRYDLKSGYFTFLLRRLGRMCLRTFVLIVCAQRCCAGNATVMSRITSRISYDWLVPKINMASKTPGENFSGRLYSFG